MTRQALLRLWIVLAVCVAVLFALNSSVAGAYLIGLPLVFFRKRRGYFYLYAGAAILITLFLLVYTVLKTLHLA
ncbi:MAG: hypothetical protein IPO91_04420 [Chloroflexi bacterium]|nr:hypothetical protein [Chloroflexota bacterium]